MPSLFRRIFVVLSRLRGGAIELSNARYERRIAQINRQEAQVRTLSDEVLQQRAAALRQDVRNGTPLDKVLIDAFTVIREAACRTVGMRPFDVQVLTGLALFDGKL